jgi:hypothetical protein
MKILRLRFVDQVELGKMAVPTKHVDDMTRVDEGPVKISYTKGDSVVYLEIVKSGIIHIVPMAQVASIVIETSNEKVSNQAGR